MNPAIHSVALIGVGNMGGAMAHNLLAQGWPLQVADIDLDKVRNLQDFGAVPLDVNDKCAIDSVAIIVCVVDAVQCEEVLFGARGVAARLQPGQMVMLCPTLAPQEVEDFAERLQALGIDTIDAPMSGGPARARDGSMSLMVACPDAVFSRFEGLIRALSSSVFRISEQVGDGARTKLVNNLLAGINLVGAAEAMVMAEKLGLDAGKTLKVIEQSSGQSWIGSDRMRRALDGDYEPRAHVTLLEKDTRLAVQAAQDAQFSGPLGVAARDVFRQAAAEGFAGQDDAVLYRFLGGSLK
jgi:3-hydroxyisobutyrate dehydrogenase